ncbi:MAG TPA: glycoside hydrolase family 13 protein [Hanamia sp.]|nr:glycoside hydrolase family 13 protein [Hanamia sp.]
MKKITFFFFLTFSFSILFGQISSYHCYPTNWWTGMKWHKVQIMIHGNNIGNANAYTINYPGVKLDKAEKVENKNYVFLDIDITNAAKPGIIKINVKKSGSSFTIDFPLNKRREGNGTQFAQGITSKDLIYLIMPDRFSNGDTTNDRVRGMRDQSLDRDTVYARHGGDLEGIENHLDYLKSLGVTALWLNPVIENDMPDRTEHGYAFTNHYKIDPRIGGEKAYHELINAAHEKNMKVIQDAVYNHIGSYHFTVLDPPMKDWLHQWPTYTNTNFRDQVLFDPYASPKEKKIMSDGWFAHVMPDLNQENPYVANFLIQHALWTVEEFGIDGWRIDTYIYNNLDFMNRCNKALMDEFPKITMFGETWVHGVLNQAYFVQNKLDLPYRSNLQAPADFQTLWAITDAMTKDFGWTDGVTELYNTLAQDFVYKDPMRNVIFLDNHDLSRFYSVVDTNMLKYKASLAWLLTCRGIPELYYGDEIGMQGFTSPNDGHVRLDFPGGWPGDPKNKFSVSGRTAREDSIWNYIATLANFRKNSSAISSGKMMQYIPQNGLYVFFRYDSKQTIMTILNTSKNVETVHTNYYSERTSGFTKMKNIETGETKTLSDFSLQPMESGVWELEK